MTRVLDQIIAVAVAGMSDADLIDAREIERLEADFFTGTGLPLWKALEDECEKRGIPCQS